MKFKKPISLVCAAVLSLGTVFAVSASAYSLGDADGDGEITAADARLVLRTSVELETLSEEAFKAADVDGDKEISASDARKVLRASVELETLHEHSYVSSVTKEATCTENGVKTFTCDCGDTYTEAIPATGHTMVNENIRSLSCEHEGYICDLYCNICEQLLQKDEVVVLDPKCSDYDNDALSSFNILVNSLKEPGSTNYFYGFTKEELVTLKPECNANDVIHLLLAGTIGGFLKSAVEDGNSTEYSDFTSRRHINNATFYVMGTPYISALEKDDIKSITTEKMNGVDFVKALPNSFKSTESGTTYDLTKIKTSTIGDVYKVTVTLNPETTTKENLPTDVTPIEKIIHKNYNSGIKQNIESIDTAFGDESMQDMVAMDISITTACTVSYYFTVDTLEPVAAKYDIDMQTVSKIYTYFDNLFQKTDEATTTSTIENNMKTENYFFFNDFFTFE